MNESAQALSTPAPVADAALIAMLSARAQAHLCSTDETLFRQGQAPDAVYLLDEGQVTLTADTVGQECVFALQSQPGSIFGLPGVLSNAPYSLTAIARTGTRLHVLSRGDFHQLLVEHPELSFQALRILAAEVQTARHILQSSLTEEILAHRAARKRSPRSARAGSRGSGNSSQTGHRA